VELPWPGPRFRQSITITSSSKLALSLRGQQETIILVALWPATVFHQISCSFSRVRLLRFLRFPSGRNNGCVRPAEAAPEGRLSLHPGVQNKMVICSDSHLLVNCQLTLLAGQIMICTST